MKPTPEDQMLYVVRFMQFMNICTVHQDFLSGRYRPSTDGMKVPDDEVDVRILAEMGNTLMFQMYSFFYSLVEGRSDTVDAFRIWREKYPEEQEAIDAMYALVQPILPELRDFRNTLGFHAGRIHAKQQKGFEFFGKYKADHIIAVIDRFKSLNAGLLAKDMARQNGSVEEAKRARAWIDYVTADPSAADWRRFGRLPGFTNCKPKYKQDNGLFPFVRLHSHSGQQFACAQVFMEQISAAYEAREREREQRRVQRVLSPRRGRRSLPLLERFRTSSKYADRPAAADIAFCVAAYAIGMDESSIEQALIDDYLSRNPSPSTRAAYIRRTMTKARDRASL